MAFIPGTRRGVYEVLAAIGEGGPPSLVHESRELQRRLAAARMRPRP